jgi:hypothetical protein
MWKHRPPSRSDSKSGTVDSGERGFFGWSKKKTPLCKCRALHVATGDWRYSLSSFFPSYNCAWLLLHTPDLPGLPVLLVILLVELPDSSHLVSSFLDSRSSAPHTPRRRGLSNHYLHYCMHDTSLILPGAFRWRRLVFFFSAGHFCAASLLTASLPSFCASGIPRSFAFTALSLAFPRGTCGHQFFKSHCGFAGSRSFDFDR